MGRNYHYIRPQLFNRSSFRLSSISHRQKSPISSHTHRASSVDEPRRCGWMVNIRSVCVCVCVCVGGCITALVTQLCFVPAAGGRKSTASYEISFPANNPSSIYISPKSEPAFPPLRAPHLFCSPFAPTIAAFISRQQKFYTTFPLLTFWWNGPAIDDRQQIPISRGCHAARRFPRKTRYTMFNQDPSTEEHLHLSCLPLTHTHPHTHVSFYTLALHL